MSIFEVAQLTQWHWFAIAGILLVAELLIGIGYLLWIGTAAAIVGILVLFVPSLSNALQLVIFSVLAVVNAVAWWAYLRRNPLQSDRPTLNRRSEQYIGRQFTLDEAIENGRGRVKIGDTYWRIEGPDLAAGTQIKVVGVDGVLLKVVAVTATNDDAA